MSEESGSEGNDNGGGGEHWSSSAPEFARNWDQVKNSATPEDFYNRVGEMRSYVGGSIRIPTEDASAEDMQAFNEKLMSKVPQLMQTPDFDNEDGMADLYKRMGKPEDVSGYSDVAGENLTFGENQLAEMKGLAHDLGLTKKQFEKLANKIGSENFTNGSEHKGKLDENVKTIQAEWGLSAEAKYQETVNFAKQAGAPQELVDGLISKSIDAPTVMWLNKMAQGLSETSQVSFQPNNSSGGTMTPFEAQEKIDEIYNNADHPYHKGVDTARKRMHDLMKSANPERYAS